MAKFYSRAVHYNSEGLLSKHCYSARQFMNISLKLRALLIIIYPSLDIEESGA